MQHKFLSNIQYSLHVEINNLTGAGIISAPYLYQYCNKIFYIQTNKLPEENVMKFSFLPKEFQFFDMFDKMADDAIDAAGVLRTLQ